MLRVRTLAVTIFEQNARILIDEKTGNSAIIDPGGDLGRISAAIEGLETGVRYIVLTHAHLDHGGKVDSLLYYLHTKGNTQVELVAHEEEKEMRCSLEKQAGLFGLELGDYENVPEPQLLAQDGMTLDLGGLKFQMLHTPGHSPGHISLFFSATPYLLEHTLWEDEVKGEGPLAFVGDVLFAGSIGRTDLPGGDYETLMKSIRNKLLCLPDETIVLSGHGPNTTIEREKRINPFLKGLV